MKEVVRQLSEMKLGVQKIKLGHRKGLNKLLGWGMPTLAVGLDEDMISPKTLEQIKTLAPNYDLLISKDEEEITGRLEDIEIAVASIPRNLFKDMPNLRWFQQWGAGADWLQNYPDVVKSNIVVTNASGVHPVQITEHVFAMLLGFARQLPKSYRAQRKKEWLKFNHNDMFELEGKIMLIVGVGAIGERLALMANAFGMTVVGMKRQPDTTVPGIEMMVGPDALHKVLPEADVVVMTIPLTNATKNFIAEEELELMKDDAVLINIGRGGTVDEDALLEYLEQGKLSGVGLDVFQQEPLPETSPLWNQERVIITAHYAGLSPRYDERAFAIFLDNLERYVKGEGLRNVVDKDLGY